MIDDLVIKPLKDYAVLAFHYGYTVNGDHRRAACLWDGIDQWVARHDPDSKRTFVAHAAHIPDDPRLSRLIDRSMTRHSYGPQGVGDVLDALMSAVLMYFIMGQPDLLAGIPANRQIDPDTGYITPRTVARTQLP